MMLRVLLVDDEPFITKGLSVLIDWKKEGYEIAGTALNGIEALEFLKKQEVDLIIADIKMPVMGGFELLKTLRSQNISDVYFIILSGYSDFDYARKAIQYHCIDYILKPVKKEELLSTLKKIANLHSSKEQIKQENQVMEQAYFSRNIIAIIQGKYDNLNLEYVENHMKQCRQLRYIDIEVNDINLNLSKEKKRELQRRLYQSCMNIIGERYQFHCIFDVSEKEKNYDIGFIYSSVMAKEQGLGEQEYLDQLLKKISLSINTPVVMYVGNRVQELSLLSESYRTAMIVRSFQAFRINKKIAYYEEEMKKSHSSLVLCKQSLDCLIQAIEQNNITEIDHYVEQLYIEMNQIGMDADLVDLNISYLLFQLIHLASEQDSNINQEEILQYINTSAFDKGTMRGSKPHMKKFAYDYANYLLQLRKNVSRGVLGEIEREIKEYYNQNLTLKELSKKYYINSAYLGQIFKKKYGQSFKDYLNNYRIEQAASKLLRTDHKIYEIAEEVGYHDFDYFINKFIAAKGCTPTKFRKQSKK